MEHGVANNKRKDRPSDAHTKRHKRGRSLEQEDITHKLQIVVHGVRVNQNTNKMRHLNDKVGSPEDRRDIGPSRDDNTPQMHDIAEENRKGREHHAQTHAEDEQAYN